MSDAAAGHPRAPAGLRHRVEACLLLGAMLLGCQLLWLAIPALSLWGLSRLVTSTTGYLLASLLVLPSALGSFSWLLSLANRRYLAIAVPPLEDEEEEDDPRRLHGPLESLLPASGVLALLALIIWIAFSGDGLSLAVG